jgi:hypothetical protein
MSQPDELPPTPHRRTIGLKIIAVAVLGLILSFGLCQVGIHLDQHVQDRGSSSFDTLGLLGLALFSLTLLAGILIALIEALSVLVNKRKR